MQPLEAAVFATIISNLNLNPVSIFPTRFQWCMCLPLGQKLAVQTGPITFTGRLNLQDLLDIHSCHLRVIARTSIRWSAAIFSLLFAGLIIVLGFLTGFKPMMFVLLAACAYFPFGWWIIDRLRVRRHYASLPDKFIEHTVTFTKDSVFCSSAASDVRLDWDQISRVVDSPRGLLFLLPENGIWFWLPERLFHDNSLKESILELATEHSIPIKKMS